jgi:hypothetical protein
MLLPLVEGIAIQAFGDAKSIKPAVAYAAWSESTREGSDIFAEALLETLSAFWVRVEFDAVGPRSHLLNRHVILHGRSVGYGTESNSLRVFLALDNLYDEVVTKRRMKVA